MPLIRFEQLEPSARYRAIAQRLVGLPPGVVLTTGHAASGKLTQLTALLTYLLSVEPRKVVLLSDEVAMFDCFLPLPSDWSIRTAEPSVVGWRDALATIPSDAIPVIAPLTRLNAAPAFALSADRWVFATLETGYLSIDVGHPLREMMVSYDQFVQAARCIWSIFLVPALCQLCAEHVTLADIEQRALPQDLIATAVARGSGCSACKGQGNDGWIAIGDVTLLPPEHSEAIRTAIEAGTEIELPAPLRLPASEALDACLRERDISIDTYRIAIARNPTLRAQQALRLEHNAVDALAADIRVLTALAERTSAGVVVADSEGHVRFANARAREALTLSASIHIESDQMGGASASVRRSLTDALVAATSDKPRATRLSVVLSNRKVVHLFVAPLPNASAATTGTCRPAMLVLGGTRFDDSLPSAADLRQYFALTPAESGIALMLCAGFVPKEVARQLEVSVPTVRSHLRSILAKTGTRRQTELISLLSSLPATTSAVGS
ncbi:MAG: helix-turn-helix transcriptional regulator [Burkholderiales bacterium]